LAVVVRDYQPAGRQEEAEILGIPSVF
jgi:hypothetical protein